MPRTVPEGLWSVGWVLGLFYFLNEMKAEEIELVSQIEPVGAVALYAGV